MAILIRFKSLNSQIWCSHLYPCLSFSAYIQSNCVNIPDAFSLGKNYNSINIISFINISVSLSLAHAHIYALAHTHTPYFSPPIPLLPSLSLPSKQNLLPSTKRLSIISFFQTHWIKIDLIFSISIRSGKIKWDSYPHEYVKRFDLVFGFLLMGKWMIHIISFAPSKWYSKYCGWFFSSRNLIYFAFHTIYCTLASNLFLVLSRIFNGRTIIHYLCSFFDIFAVWYSLSKRLNLWYCLLFVLFFTGLGCDLFDCRTVEMLIGDAAGCCCCRRRFSLINLYTWW